LLDFCEADAVLALATSANGGTQTHAQLPLIRFADAFMIDAALVANQRAAVRAMLNVLKSPTRIALLIHLALRRYQSEYQILMHDFFTLNLLQIYVNRKMVLWYWPGISRIFGLTRTPGLWHTGTMFKRAMAVLCMLVGSTAMAQELSPLPPADVQSEMRVGKASWYGMECATKKMANGKRFNPKARTAASYYWPLGTKVRVTNVRNGKSVVVEITDRGPLKSLGRLIDLSESAATALGYHNNGVTLVEVRAI
jgi:rare lipoprotein A